MFPSKLTLMWPNLATIPDSLGKSREIIVVRAVAPRCFLILANLYIWR